MIENIEVFEKICIEKFNFNNFKEKYLNEHEEKEYNLSSLKNIDGILVESLFIKDEYQHLGHGSKVIESLKRYNKPIVVYAIFESINFWEKHGFESVDGHEYIYVFDS